MWRSRERERGATAVLTALLLVALVGFTGLAVDGGATMAKQQEMQNGADAAALAAASECGKNGCEPGAERAAMDSAAGPYGQANVTGVKGVTTTFSVDLSAHTVTAELTGLKEHSFLPVVGIDESALHTTATAIWENPTEGPSMLPIAFSECTFSVQAGGVPGTKIWVYIPKDNKHTPDCPDSAYPPGGFGWLEVDPPNGDGECAANIVVGEEEQIVKGDEGFNHPNSCEFSNFVGETVLIPIFSYSDGTGASGTYTVSQFAAFKIHGFYIQSYGSYGEDCKGDNPMPSGYMDSCFVGEFIEYVTDAEGYLGDDEESDVAIVRLID